MADILNINIMKETFDCIYTTFEETGQGFRPTALQALLELANTIALRDLNKFPTMDYSASHIFSVLDCIYQFAIGVCGVECAQKKWDELFDEVQKRELDDAIVEMLFYREYLFDEEF